MAAAAAPQLSLGLGPHNNRGLFANHFLDELLPREKSWQAEGKAFKDLRALYEAVYKIWEKESPTIEKAKEAQAEEDFIRPVLKLLGFENRWIVQPNLKVPGSVNAPDYAVFPSVEATETAKQSQADNDAKAFWSNCSLVIDAKRWNRPLDQGLPGTAKSAAAAWDNKNPSVQIYHYLSHSKVAWGVVTSGARWRLFNRERSLGLVTFYEFDLDQFLKDHGRNPKDAALLDFQYFSRFFGADAFEVDATGKSFLEKVLTESQDYTVRVEKKLKDRAYRVLETLVDGFYQYSGNRLKESDLPESFEASLILLYRLLFLRFGESKLRRLLPMDRPGNVYRDNYSLHSLLHEIARERDERKGLHHVGTRHWSRLLDLFALINPPDLNTARRNEKEIGVFAYNGGLFEEERCPLLARCKMEDRSLAEALDLLTREEIEDTGGKGFIDYSDIGVEQLGSIYEGLLEFKPRLAAERLVCVRAKKGEEYVSEKEAVDRKPVKERGKPVTVEPGHVYLVNDKGERKATGSYYTPDYIVEYIVDRTLGPICEGKTKEEILELNVLDPAMGSGHFLVAATDYLANRCEQAEPATPGSKYAELDVYALKRVVVERCIHGVDINPLAVELTKLSLWLHTATRNRALNYLDHHLKVGNSLLGAWIDELERAPEIPAAKGKAKSTKAAKPKRGKKAVAGQATFVQNALQLRIERILSRYQVIDEMPSHTAEQVHEKEQKGREIEEIIEPLRDVADLWMSAWFGNGIDQVAYDAPLYGLNQPISQWRKDWDEKAYLKRARDIAGRPTSANPHWSQDGKRFFHWELEFPEMYFDGKGRKPAEDRGFDAVIGNPPYKDVKLLPPELAQYIFDRFQRSENRINIYSVFIDVALSLLHRAARFGFIVPNSIATQSSYKKLREFLIRDFQINEIVRVPDDTFAEAVVETIILTIATSKENVPILVEN